MDEKALGIWIWKECSQAIVPRQYGMKVWEANGFPYVSISAEEITLQQKEIEPSLHNVMEEKYKTYLHSNKL